MFSFIYKITLFFIAGFFKPPQKKKVSDENFSARPPTIPSPLQFKF